MNSTMTHNVMKSPNSLSSIITVLVIIIRLIMRVGYFHSNIAPVYLLIITAVSLTIKCISHFNLSIAVISVGSHCSTHCIFLIVSQGINSV